MVAAAEGLRGVVVDQTAGQVVQASAWRGNQRRRGVRTPGRGRRRVARGEKPGAPPGVVGPASPPGLGRGSAVAGSGNGVVATEVIGGAWPLPEVALGGAPG